VEGEHTQGCNENNDGVGTNENLNDEWEGLEEDDRTTNQALPVSEYVTRHILLDIDVYHHEFDIGRATSGSNTFPFELIKDVDVTVFGKYKYPVCNEPSVFKSRLELQSDDSTAGSLRVVDGKAGLLWTFKVTGISSSIEMIQRANEDLGNHISAVLANVYGYDHMYDYGIPAESLLNPLEGTLVTLETILFPSRKIDRALALLSSIRDQEPPESPDNDTEFCTDLLSLSICTRSSRDLLQNAALTHASLLSEGNNCRRICELIGSFKVLMPDGTIIANLNLKDGNSEFSDDTNRHMTTWHSEEDTPPVVSFGAIRELSFSLSNIPITFFEEHLFPFRTADDHVVWEGGDDHFFHVHYGNYGETTILLMFGPDESWLSIDQDSLPEGGLRRYMQAKINDTPYQMPDPEPEFTCKLLSVGVVTDVVSTNLDALGIEYE